MNQIEEQLRQQLDKLQQDMAQQRNRYAEQMDDMRKEAELHSQNILKMKQDSDQQKWMREQQEVAQASNRSDPP